MQMLAGRVWRAVIQLTSKDLEGVVDEGVVEVLDEVVEEVEVGVADTSVVNTENVEIMRGGTTRIEDLDRIEEIRMVDIVETEMADIVVETEMVVIVGGIVATTEVATVMEVEVVTGVVVVVLVMALVAITEEEITLSPSNY